MEDLICIISFSKGWLDDDFYIYRNGNVRHIYDQSPFKANLERFYTAEELPKQIRTKLLEKCEPNQREELEHILV